MDKNELLACLPNNGANYRIYTLDEYAGFEHRKPVNFETPGQIFLAPMVRSSSLSMRLTALQYGTAAAFSEVVVDQRLLACVVLEDHSPELPMPLTRVLHPDTIRKGLPLFGDALVTCAADGPLVLQIASAEPQRAAAAAVAAAKFASVVDFNAGCGHDFASKGGMGVVLLQNVPLLCSILETCRAAIPTNTQLTVKTRVLHTPQETAGLVARLAETGVSAITLHARVPKQERTCPPRWLELRQALEILAEKSDEFAEKLGVSGRDGRLDILINSRGERVVIVVNGGIWLRSDCERVCSLSGCSSCMVARTAVHNMSVFAPGLTGPAAPPPSSVADAAAETLFSRANAVVHAGMAAPPILYARRLIVNAVAGNAPLRNTKFNIAGIFGGSVIKAWLNNESANVKTYDELLSLFALPPLSVVSVLSGHNATVAALQRQECLFRAAANAGLLRLADAGCEYSVEPQKSDPTIYTKMITESACREHQMRLDAGTPDVAAFRAAAGAEADASEREDRMIVDLALCEEWSLQFVARRDGRKPGAARPAEQE